MTAMPDSNGPTTTPQHRADVAVIGGGQAGLATGFYLRRVLPRASSHREALLGGAAAAQEAALAEADAAIQPS